MTKQTVYKLGSSGPMVERIQQVLIDKGFLSADLGGGKGKFGPLTQQAVMAYQDDNWLEADGMVGPVTLTKMGLIADSNVKVPLTDKMIADAAIRLGIEAAVLQAISEVESRGSGFHPTGEVKVLYERHIFNRYAREYGMDLLADLLHTHRPDICSSTPGDYEGGLAENRQLADARRVNPYIALMSASYGRFQIMGFHFRRLGFSTPEAFYNAMCESEEAQLELLCLFMLSSEGGVLIHAARNKDWATFANVYNGPKHDNYDVKLKASYEKFVALTQ